MHLADRLPRFASETEAKAWLVAHLGPRVGRLEREVWMSHPLPEIQLEERRRQRQGVLRIDFVAVIRGFRHDPTEDTLIGLEAKDGRGGWQQWAKALCQATAYRYGRVQDRRSTRYFGQSPRYVFVWPDPRDTADWMSGSHAGWLEGTERAFGAFHVGTIRYRGATAYRPEELVFNVSSNPIWSTVAGPRNAANFATHVQVGAR